MTFQYTPRQFDPLPKGLYYVTIEQVNPAEINKFKKEPDDPDTVFGITTVVVEDENGDIEFAKRKIWKTLNPYSKQIFDWYFAATGKNIVPGKEGVSFNEQEMVGKMVRLMIGQKEMPNGSIKNVIESVTPLPKSYGKPAPADETAEATEDEIDGDSIPF